MLKKVLPVICAVAGSIVAAQAQIYIGDSYFEGLNITAGNAGDSSAATYAMVETPLGDGVSGVSYYSSVTQTLTVIEVNFYSQVETVGTVTPFLAIYSGAQDANSVRTGSNYNVFLVGDALATSSVSLHNASFTVGGLNPTFELTLNPGQTLVAGYTTSVAGGLVANTDTLTATPDYILLGSTIPSMGALPNGTTTLNRIEKFNIGFEVAAVPEPSAAVMAIIGLGCLMFVGKVRRKRRARAAMLH